MRVVRSGGAAVITVVAILYALMVIITFFTALDAMDNVENDSDADLADVIFLAVSWPVTFAWYAIDRLRGRA